VLSPDQLTTQCFLRQPVRESNPRPRIESPGILTVRRTGLEAQRGALIRIRTGSPCLRDRCSTAVSFEGVLAPMGGIEPPDRSVNSRLPYHLASSERGGSVSCPFFEIDCQTSGRADVVAPTRLVPGAGIEPAFTGSESVVLPAGRSRNVMVGGMGIEPTSIGLRDRCVALTPTSLFLRSSFAQLTSVRRWAWYRARPSCSPCARAALTE
jgi:hypothetical protein